MMGGVEVVWLPLNTYIYIYMYTCGCGCLGSDACIACPAASCLKQLRDGDVIATCNKYGLRGLQNNCPDMERNCMAKSLCTI